MSVPFDLLEVTWGNEILRARPVRWNKDLNDSNINLETAEDIFITAYELACPKCGSLCSFEIVDAEIMCECGSKTKNPIDINPEIDNDGVILISDDDVKWIIDSDEYAPNHGEPEPEPKPEPEPEPERESKKAKRQTPENILDNLTASIMNTEINLEEPDEKDKILTKKSKRLVKRKTEK